MSPGRLAPTRLRHALDIALARYAEVMAEPFPAKVTLTILEADAFVALVQADNDTVEITVSTGVVADTAALWNRALDLSDALPQEHRVHTNAAGIDTVIDQSLAWLMLHELHHHEIGHLGLVGAAGITETSIPAALSLTRRSDQSPSPLDRIGDGDNLAIRQCLELQADHDAFEILIGPYDPSQWNAIRMNASAAMAMMVLIDQQDHVEDQERTHPLSATRISSVSIKGSDVPSAFSGKV